MRTQAGITTHVSLVSLLLPVILYRCSQSDPITASLCEVPVQSLTEFACPLNITRILFHDVYSEKLDQTAKDCILQMFQSLCSTRHDCLLPWKVTVDQCTQAKPDITIRYSCLYANAIYQPSMAKKTNGYKVMPAQTHIQSPGYPSRYNGSQDETLRFIMEAQRESWVEVRVHDCGELDPCPIRIFEYPDGEGVTPYPIDPVLDSRMYVKKVYAKSRIVIDANMAKIKRLWISYQFIDSSRLIGSYSIPDVASCLEEKQTVVKQRGVSPAMITACILGALVVVQLIIIILVFTWNKKTRTRHYGSRKSQVPDGQEAPRGNGEHIVRPYEVVPCNTVTYHDRNNDSYPPHNANRGRELCPPTAPPREHTYAEPSECIRSPRHDDGEPNEYDHLFLTKNNNNNFDNSLVART